MMGQKPQRRIGRSALCHPSRPTGGARADVNARAERTKPRGRGAGEDWELYTRDRRTWLTEKSVRELGESIRQQMK